MERKASEKKFLKNTKSPGENWPEEMTRLNFGGYTYFFHHRQHPGSIWLSSLLIAYNSATTEPFDLQTFPGILSTFFQQFIYIASASEVFFILEKIGEKFFFADIQLPK